MADQVDVIHEVVSATDDFDLSVATFVRLADQESNPGHYFHALSPKGFAQGSAKQPGLRRWLLRRDPEKERRTFFRRAHHSDEIRGAEDVATEACWIARRREQLTKATK